ncbi:MAG: hypothetical protein AAF206_29855 [Bacteroidota bacterium]
MKRIQKLLLVLGCALGLVHLQAQSLDRMVIASGGIGFGAPGSGGAEKLSYTIGEDLIGSFSIPSNIVTVGFQQSNPPGANLPVEWLGLYANWEGQNAHISWIVANEVNNHYFELERSLDGEHFQPIGKILSHPADPAYRLVDPEAKAQRAPILYYQVRQVDWDGRFSYSNRIALHLDREGRLDGIVYPNPTDRTAQFRLNTAAETPVFLELLDGVGRILWQQEKRPELLWEGIPLPTAELPAGRYYLRVLQDERQQSFQILKRR